MRITRRTLIAALGTAPAVGLLPGRAFAAYPDRPIHLIVPFAAGGNADIVGRIVGDQIARGVKQPVVVENRDGAGGAIGAELVARTAPDGYTLLVGSNGPLTINAVMHAKLSYDPLTDFAPVAMAAYVPHAIVVGNGFPGKTLQELIQRSKTTPVNVATSGVGSATHFTLERLKAATGANLTHIPYRSGGALMPDVIAGNVDAAMTELSIAMALHKGGKGRVLAVAARERSRLGPDIPTFIESGVKDFTATSYVGVLAPAKTPAEIILQLQKAMVAGLTGGDAPGKLREIGDDIATEEQMTPDGFARFIRTDLENMRAAAKLANIEPQ